MDNKELLERYEQTVDIPAGSYIYFVSHDVIESGCQMDHGPRQVSVPHIRMGKYPVTNLQYQVFLRETGYAPADSHNFLVGWKDGKCPAGSESLPVTWVSQNDAKAYAAWKGGRLPWDEEWQYAAGGPEKLRYPWGAVLEELRCNGTGDGLTPVDRYKNGASPFGVMDMCGNCHEWTQDVIDDGMSLFALLRGGSYLQRPAIFHISGGARPNTHHQKFYLLNEGQNRCGTVGFRCVWDA